MLTEEQIIENKLRYFDLVSKLNFDITNLSKYLLMSRVDFFTKPFATYPAAAYAGSLCEHSLKVYDELTKLCNLYYPGKYSDEDIIKVALFKDLYRAELFEPFSKNTKDETTGEWTTTISYRTKDESLRPVFGDINFSSYMIIKKFIDDLSDEVVEAICYSAPGSNNIELQNIRSSYKLATLTTMAEIATLYLGD